MSPHSGDTKLTCLLSPYSDMDSISSETNNNHTYLKDTADFVMKAPNCLFILAVALPRLSLTSVSYILKVFSKEHKVQRNVS